MNVSLEFALNLLWAVISLALLLGTREITPHAQSARALRSFAVIALICVLFPIISITDDLNSAPAIVETRQSAEFASQNQHSSGPAGALPPLLPLHLITLTAHQQESVSAIIMLLLPGHFAFNQNRRPPPGFPV